MKKDWQDKKDSFQVIDVRKLTGNFLPMVLKKAKNTSVGEGICVVQSFEPIPLYSALSDLGFEHLTDRVSESEYRVYFFRKEVKDASTPTGMDVPLKPLAILNFKRIDDELADIVVHFWELIWGKEDAAIDQKTKYLLSLANAVGAGRMRQATRELVKAYADGVTVEELDELFALLAWNHGPGTFASQIGPSTLFGAYKLIKSREKNGVPKEEVLKQLVERFGETNRDSSALFKDNTMENKDHV